MDTNVFEIMQLTKALEDSTLEKQVLKDLAVRHLAALEEAQAENRALREAVKQLTADVAHYAQFGPLVPALPKAMVGGGEGEA